MSKDNSRIFVPEQGEWSYMVLVVEPFHNTEISLYMHRPLYICM
jgi:hypothetical protein